MHNQQGQLIEAAQLFVLSSPLLFFLVRGFGGSLDRSQQPMGAEMAKNEKTSKRVASKASKILRSAKSSKATKSVAGSALTQAADKRKASAKPGKTQPGTKKTRSKK